MSTPTLDFACAAEEPNPIATTDRARTAADTITAGSVPDLAAYDILLVNISAGKDSQASLDVVAAHARAAGMSRLSCRFCVLASRADLVCSARLNPKLADQYAAVEAATGHMFRADLSMADIVAEARGHQTQLSLLELAEIA
ncbi:hypothetical protein [Mycobacterium avium]|uniref:hypothetical protein n=1 Tax=Mycobacterium avium TaxID=1764 RepID=UPI000A9FAB2C|nr:hypothetical protein [Mycobacterium avium]